MTNEEIETKVKKLSIFYGQLEHIMPFIGYGLEDSRDKTIPGLFKTSDGRIVTIDAVELPMNLRHVRSIMVMGSFIVITYNNKDTYELKYCILNKEYNELKMPLNDYVKSFTTINLFRDSKFEIALYVAGVYGQYIVHEDLSTEEMRLGIRAHELKKSYSDRVDLAMTLIQIYKTSLIILDDMIFITNDDIHHLEIEGNNMMRAIRAVVTRMFISESDCSARVVLEVRRGHSINYNGENEEMIIDIDKNGSNKPNVREIDEVLKDCKHRRVKKNYNTINCSFKIKIV